MFKEGPNRFYLVDENNKMHAEITYTCAGDGIYIIDHTYVEPSHQGQGIAKKLVLAVVQKARSENKKIVPLCPFANAEFERNIQYQDVKK
jgi:uncharacterized protein